MSRILFVSTSTTLGGAEKTLHALATLLNPKSFTVSGVVSLKPPGAYARRLQDQGVQVLSLDLQGWPSLRDLRRLGEIIESLRPDLVHALMYQAIQLCRLAKRRAFPFKLVSSPRVSYRTRPAWSLLADRLLKGADDLLISECASSREFLVRRLGYDPAKVRTIYNGVDISGWSVSGIERQHKRLELRLESRELLIGTIGRLDLQKGHAVLIEAMARLRERVPLRCVIIGEGPQGPGLRDRVGRLALENRVWLLGEREDASSWLSGLDLFVLPSLWEGLPNALLEAMALGLPVVASGVDGVREVVQDDQNGILVPPGEPEALARAIAALAQDPAARGRLGQAARATISQRFSLLSMLAGYEGAYSEVLAG